MPRWAWDQAEVVQISAGSGRLTGGVTRDCDRVLRLNLAWTCLVFYREGWVKCRSPQADSTHSSRSKLSWTLKAFKFEILAFRKWIKR